MTCVATDGRTMAADSRVTNDANTILSDEELKLARTKAGWIVGIAGTPDLLHAAVQALETGKQPMLDSDTTLLVLLPGGELRRYSEDGWARSQVPDAIGTGHKHALTAMDCGKSPAEAVAMAIRRDPFCGGKVMVMEPGKVRAPQRRARA